MVATRPSSTYSQVHSSDASVFWAAARLTEEAGVVGGELCGVAGGEPDDVGMLRGVHGAGDDDEVGCGQLGAGVVGDTCSEVS